MSSLGLSHTNLAAAAVAGSGKGGVTHTIPNAGFSVLSKSHACGRSSGMDELSSFSDL